VSHAEERPGGAARARSVARRARDVASRVHSDPAAAAETPTYQGLVTRTIAFTLDAVVINLVALAVGGAVGLAASVLDLPSGVQDALIAAGGVAWLVWSSGYFVVFWATTGQTPGDRLLRIRVCDADDFTSLRPRRAFLRLIYLTLAAIPLFAGFLPILFDDRRRGVHDMLAGSVVVGTDQERPAGAK
jgi:uncharacterized RDD family membrane protein YckC